MTASASNGLAYARDVTARLWPGASLHVARGTRQPALAQWWPLPDPRRPTVLVPVSVPGAARMLQRHGSGLVPRGFRATLRWLVRHDGLGAPVPRLALTGPASTRSIIDCLQDHLPDVASVGVILGTPRPNRKPVLQVFADDGRTVAFVKVGVDETSRRLVRAEGANLKQVSGSLKVTQAPTVLALDRFEEQDVLVLSPLEASQSHRRHPFPFDAMAEVSRVCGTNEWPLADSPFWAHIGETAQTSADSEPLLLTRRYEQVKQRWADAVLEFGSWHGDWAPWNCGPHGGRVQVWDWERFASDVPVGFDVIHYAAQMVRHGQAGTQRSQAQLRDQLARLLRQMHAHRAAAQADLVLALYLLEIAVRFSKSGTSHQLHPRAAWALDWVRDLAA